MLSLSSEEPSALVPRNESQTMLPATWSHVKTQAEGPHFPCVLVVVQFPCCGMSPWITAGLAFLILLWGKASSILQCLEEPSRVWPCD